MTVYLDNSATTRPSPEVVRRVEECLRGGWYNPSALYRPALEAQKAVEEVRGLCLAAAGVREGKVIFTAGGTEADNLALLGALKRKRTPAKVLLSAVEHPAVSACAEEITRLGFRVEEIPVGPDGRVDLNRLKEMMTPDTALIAVMQVNNETGAIQPLREIASLRDRYCPEAVFHVDGVQGFLRVPVLLSDWGVQSYALSGHKIHAVKGIGALVLTRGAGVRPLIFGGGQEEGLRSGTENTPGIAALGEAIRTWDPAAGDRMRELKIRLWQGVLREIPEALVNGPAPDSAEAAPHILNLALPPVRSQTMLFALEGDGIYVSAGSACASRKQKISPVLRAMGVPTLRADCSLRFSLCPETTAEEIDYTAERVAAHFHLLKKYVRR